MRQTKAGQCSKHNRHLIDNCTRSNGGGWSSSDYGYITLTLKTDTSKKLEFPAVGDRLDYSSGTLNSAGSEGDYWSSVASGSGGAYLLWFNNNSVNVGNGNKLYGRSVRCVRQ